MRSLEYTLLRRFFVALWMISSMLLVTLSAQEDFVLRGVVIDAQAQRIETGNVLIYHLQDTTLQTGDMFIDGKLQHRIRAKFPILLALNTLGFAEYQLPLLTAPPGDTLNLDTIRLMSTMLNTIEVSARKSMVTQRGSQTVVHIANTPLENAGTALDLLRSVPKVLFNQAGQITVLGKGNAIIYLDGQRVTSQMISSLASVDISRIEVLENPPPKYEAEGNAVINIVTKQKSLEGYKLSLLKEAGWGKFFRSFFQGNAYLQQDRWMLRGSYSLRPWTWGGRNIQERSLVNAISSPVTKNHFIQRNKRLDHDFSVLLHHRLSPGTSIGARFTGSVRDGQRSADNNRILAVNNAPSLHIQSDLSGTYRQQNLISQVYLAHQLDTIGSSLEFNAQYAQFDFQRNENILQRLLEGEMLSLIDRLSTNINDIQILSFQGDYRKHFSPALSWDSGLKYARISNSSKVLLADQEENGEHTLITDFSNRFNYSESIWAGYSQLNYTSNFIDLMLGVRVEQTTTSGLSKQSETSEDYGKSYLNLFPSMRMKMRFSDNFSPTVEYNYRINRPLFQDLNPYVIFVDSLLSLKGNPFLRPAYAHNFSINLPVKSINIGVSYQRNRDPVNQIFRSVNPNDLNIIAFLKENLLQTELYSMSIGTPFQYKFTSGYINAGLFYDDHRVRDFDQSINSNNKLGYLIQANQSCNLIAKIKFDIFANYTSSRVDGVYLDNPISFVNLSLSRKFLNDSLTLRLWANDIFDRYKFTGTTRFNNMQATYLSEGDWHYFKIVLQWDFGALQPKNQERKISREELNRINTNQN